MNYEIVKDREKLENFLDWLPDLEPDEKFYVSLFARKKYSNGSMPSVDKSSLRRFVADKTRLIDKLEQLELPFGKWKMKGEPVTQESLAVYIIPNPRCMRTAAYKTMQELLSKVQKPEPFNPHAQALTVSRGGRDTEEAAKTIVSAPINSAFAPQGEKIVDIIPKAATIDLPNGRGQRYIALVFLQMEDPQDSPLKEYQKRKYRLLAYYQKDETFDKSSVTSGLMRPIGGLMGMGGYYTYVWVDPEYRGSTQGVPNVFKLIMSYAKKKWAYMVLCQKAKNARIVVRKLT